MQEFVPESTSEVVVFGFAAGLPMPDTGSNADHNNRDDVAHRDGKIDGADLKPASGIVA